MLPKSRVEVTFSLTDSAAPGNAALTIVSGGVAPYSTPNDILNPYEKQYQPIFTLEPGLWLLDGSMLPPDGEPGLAMPMYRGYVSNVLSRNDSGFTFDTDPDLRILLSAPVTVPIAGITVVWGKTYGEWPLSFRITTYLSNLTVVDELQGVATSPETIMPTTGPFDRVDIQIYSWCLPYRRARIEQILFGSRLQFADNDIVTTEHTEFVDYLASSLPENTFTFTIDNTDGRWNPLNPSGLYRFLIDRQIIQVRYGLDLNGGTEWINGGVFFLTDWDTPQNGISATFTAKNVFALMTETYTGPLTGSIGSVITSAYAQAGVPALPGQVNPLIVDDDLFALDMPAGYSGEHTVGEIIQLLAGAARRVVWCDRDGALRILQRDEIGDAAFTGYRIDQFNSFEQSSVRLSSQLRKITVTSDGGTVTRSFSAVGDVLEIKNPFITAQAGLTADELIDYAAAYVGRREMYSGNYRPDTRLEPLDVVLVENRYGWRGVRISRVRYSYNGAFRGFYEGRESDIIVYNRHMDLKDYTHAKLGGYTHDELRNEVVS
jgi:hypothetical protein